MAELFALRLFAATVLDDRSGALLQQRLVLFLVSRSRWLRSPTGVVS